MAAKHVPGRKAGNVMMYALSTCPWCRKAKALLDDMGVEYYYEDVDMLSGDDKKKALDIVKKWNPASNFPTIVIDDEKCIIGFKEDEIREALK